MVERVAIIGFGEAGSTFAIAGKWGDRTSTFDILAARKADAVSAGICWNESANAATRGATLALSLVTADQALAAARECALSLEPGALWCDMNSVAPDTKRSAAEAIAGAGGRYVDVAVMAPVNPAGMAVPLLLAGPDAQDAADALASLGFTNLRIVGDKIGQASAIKMIRSVVLKGMEALSAEMLLAAEKAGVVDEVIASLDASEKHRPWREKIDYHVERMTTHGLRRAAEMEESAKTLESLGVEPVMTRGTVRRQREMARAKPEGNQAA